MKNIISRKFLKDRVCLTLIDGDHTITREITYLELNTAKCDILGLNESLMYKQMDRMKYGKH